MKKSFFILMLFASCNWSHDEDRLEVVVGKVDSVKRVLSSVISYKLHTYYHFSKNDTIFNNVFVYCCENAWSATYWPGDSVEVVYNWSKPKKSYIVKIVHKFEEEQ